MIYISDLDGTLLRKNMTISEFSRNGLLHLLAEGVDFTVASARSITSMRNVLGDIPFRLPIVEFNGARISDYQTGRHEIVNSLPGETAVGLYEIIDKHRCVPFISTFDGREDRLYYAATINEGMDWYLNDRRRVNDRRLRWTPGFRECLSDHVMTFNVIDRRERLEPVRDEIERAFPSLTEISFFEELYSPGWHWLQIYDRRASKDQGIRALAEMMGVRLDDMTVFGDQVNDVKMFKVAGRAIAVANAVPAVKACASEIIGTNEEDSVIRYILNDLGMGAL